MREHEADIIFDWYLDNPGATDVPLANDVIALITRIAERFVYDDRYHDAYQLTTDLDSVAPLVGPALCVHGEHELLVDHVLGPCICHDPNVPAWQAELDDIDF